MYNNSPKAKRVEFRAADPTANPYLAFSAMLMAGLDGIKNAIEPPTPLDKDLYALNDEERRLVDNTPESLLEALNALQRDHAFLLEGGVFTPDLLSTWIEYKMENEVHPLALRPHPYEFQMYYSA